MFINEAEVKKRLESSANLLSRVRRDEAADPVPLIIPGESPESKGPSETGDPAPADKEATDGQSTLNSKELKKLLYDTKVRDINKRNLNAEEHASLGLTTLLLGKNSAAAIVGVHESHADNVAHGFTHNNDRTQHLKGPKEQLLLDIQEQSRPIVNIVFNRLKTTLDNMTDEKIAATKSAKDLSLVARNLHNIISAATPKVESESAQQVHFHIYRPVQAEEKSYNIINVGSGSTHDNKL